MASEPAVQRNSQTVSDPWANTFYGTVSLSGPARSSPPPIAERRRLLEEQDGRCFYCGLPFGAIVSRRGKPVSLRLNWDHLIPFSYSNRNAGYVAACHVCNHIKKDRIFDSPVAAQNYVKTERFRRGYRGVML